MPSTDTTQPKARLEDVVIVHFGTSDAVNENAERWHQLLDGRANCTVVDNTPSATESGLVPELTSAATVIFRDNPGYLGAVFRVALDSPSADG